MGETSLFPPPRGQEKSSKEWELLPNRGPPCRPCPGAYFPGLPGHLLHPCLVLPKRPWSPSPARRGTLTSVNLPLPFQSLPQARAYPRIPSPSVYAGKEPPAHPNRCARRLGWVCHLLFCSHVGASLMGSLPQCFIRELSTFTEHIYFPRGSAGKETAC